MLILGIHIDPPHVWGALVQKRRKEIEIRALKTAFLSEPDHVKQLYNPSGATKNHNFNGRVVSGISAKDFLIRSLELKISNHRHMEEALTFQSEATSHFNPKDIITVPLLQKKDKESTEALLFTVPKDTLTQHLTELAKLELDPDAVSTIPSALCYFVRWKFPHLLDAFIIDLGSSVWTCAWMEKGQLKKAHAISGGIEALLAALLEDRKKIFLKKEIENAAKQIDLLLLKPGLNPHLTKTLDELHQELSKVHSSFQRGADSKPIILTGRSDAFIHLSEFLIGTSEKKWSLTLEEQKFAPSLGLAFTQFSSHPLQLRQKEFFPQKNWRKMGFYAVFLIASAFFLSGTLFYFGFRSFQLRKLEMLHSLQPSSQKKTLHAKGNVDEKINRWISAIETNNKEYFCILQAPKVTEVFSWFSAHPLLNKLIKEGDPIALRDIRYQLVTFPKIGSPKEPYLAKVEIEFRVKNAMNARKFHEAIREGDDYVDPNLEITWEALHDSYRISFFLKNRSLHVP